VRNQFLVSSVLVPICRKKVFSQIWESPFRASPGSGYLDPSSDFVVTGITGSLKRHCTYLKRLVWPVLRFITGFNKPLIVINLAFCIIHSSKVSLVSKILILSILKKQNGNNFSFLRSHEETIITLNNTIRKNKDLQGRENLLMKRWMYFQVEVHRV